MQHRVLLIGSDHNPISGKYICDLQTDLGAEVYLHGQIRT